MPRAATMRSNARQRSEEATVARYIGQCQVCEGDFKLLGGRLVHHGYKRPGYGEIVGDCPGVHEPPYEVSCELVKVLLAKHEPELAAAKDYLVEVLKEYRQLPSRDSYAVRSAMWAKTKGVADLLKGLSPPIVDAVIDLAGLNNEVDELDIRRMPLGGSYDSFSQKRDRQ